MLHGVSVPAVLGAGIRWKRASTLSDYPDTRSGRPGRGSPETEKEDRTTRETEAGPAVDGMRVFLNALARTPLLTPAEEVVLAKGVERGDPSAQRRLVEANLRLVVAIARQYGGLGLPLEDLVQEGAIGLQRAVEKYDWRRGHRFSTYAYWWIRQAVQRALINQGRRSGFPATSSSGASNSSGWRRCSPRSSNASRPRRSWLSGWAFGRSSSRPCARCPMRRSPWIGRRARTRLKAPSPGQRIPNAADPVDSLDRVEARPTPIGCWKAPSRERRLIEAHFGLDGPALPLTEVALGMGITSERARQIERRALDRLALQEEASTRRGAHDVPKPLRAAPSRDRGPARRGPRRARPASASTPRTRGVARG